MLKKIVLGIFCFFTLAVHSQSNVLRAIQNAKLPIFVKIAKIDSVLNLEKRKRNDSLFSLKNQYAFWLYKNKQLSKAITVSNDVVTIANSLKDTIKIQKSFFWLGFFYKKNNTPSKAFLCFIKSLKYNDSNAISANSYFQLASLYNRINDYNNAITYYKLAILILKRDKSRISKLRDTYTNISDIYFKNKKHLLEGITFCKKADSIANKIPTPKNKKYLIKIILATLYNEKETLNIPIAYKYYQEAMAIAKSENNINHINEVNLLIGNLYNSTDAKKSIYYLNLVKQRTKKEDSLLISQLYFNYALTYDFLKQYKKSVSAIKKAISYKIGKRFTENLFKDTAILEQTKYKAALLHFLPHYATIYLHYYNATKNEVFLQKSLFYYKLSDKLIDLLKVNSNEFKSKLFWREISTEIYNRAIEICYRNNNYKDAFYFMEKNKALVLTEDIINHNYKRSLEISKKLLDKERNFKDDLIRLKNEQTIKKDSLFKAIIGLERNLHAFQDSIYNEKIGNKTPKILNIATLQKKITDNSLFVEYHISNTNGFVMIITKSKVFFLKLKDFSNLKQHISKLLISLKKPFYRMEDVNHFNSLSYKIYNILFPSLAIRNLVKGKNLIIIPDNYLLYLPFETLITQKENSKYLIEHCTISYSYSTTFLFKNSTMHRNPKKEFIGFAPITFKDTNLATLGNSKNEVTALSSIFSGDSFIDKKATKQHFKTLCNSYNIIHLATHAYADNQKSPWIAFKNKKLSLAELYATKTQADLVVLSACNSSIGKMTDGEGLLSLTRGFFSSGSNAVISSLWNVNDKVSATIMVDFYKNLKNKETKAVALRKAKLNYLKNHTLTLASPYYWSSYILIGNANKLKPIRLHTQNATVIRIIAFFIAIFLTMLFVRKS